VPGDDELATVCYLCQGQIAPEHAGIDLGLASKLAMRSVGVATGRDAEAVTAAFLEAGDLGEAAEAVLPDREPSLTVGEVVETLHEIARSEGVGSQGRKIDLLAGLLARATPLEARYLLRLVTGSLRLGIGTPTILEALAVVHAGGRKDRPVLERAYNICCDLGLVASTLVAGGLDAVEAMSVRPGNPVRVMLAQRLSEAVEILAKLGGRCSAEHKYDGMRVQAHRTADGSIELFTRRQERVSTQFPDVGICSPPGSARRRRSSRGRSSPTTPRPASCARSPRSCSAAASTASPRPRGTCRSPCSASRSCTPTARTSPACPTRSVGSGWLPR